MKPGVDVMTSVLLRVSGPFFMFLFQLLMLAILVWTYSFMKAAAWGEPGVGQDLGDRARWLWQVGWDCVGSSAWAYHEHRAGYLVWGLGFQTSTSLLLCWSWPVRLNSEGNSS